ncbi:hypothetical protein Tco_0749248 [Tanacetum coccineum]|uniref:Uncharacterized protein n=1 Tax=Tanacetum coccineum TaxID=301880 RepID=A0ABQ4Z0X7_9ASTR
MVPLPNINKAYYIVQQVEKQKQVTHQVNDPTALFANFNKKNGQGSSSKREARENKVENRGEKKRDTPFQMDDENKVTGVKMDIDLKLFNVVCQEMMKMTKDKRIDCNINKASTSKPHARIFLSSRDIQTGLSFHASIKF